MLLAPFDSLLDIRICPNRIRLVWVFSDGPISDRDADMVEAVRSDLDYIGFGYEIVPGRVERTSNDEQIYQAYIGNLVLTSDS